MTHLHRGEPCWQRALWPVSLPATWQLCGHACFAGVRPLTKCGDLTRAPV